MSVVTFETLREIQRKEKKSERLSELKDEFYKAAKEYFERTAVDSYRDELRNAQNIFDDIIERREKKILNYALSSVRLREKADTKLMTTREWELYESLVAAIKNYREATDLKGAKFELKELEKPQTLSDLAGEKNNGKGFLKIELLDELPEIVGADLKEYGPFKKGDVATIPKENAQLFISNGKAKEL